MSISQIVSIAEAVLQLGSGWCIDAPQLALGAPMSTLLAALVLVCLIGGAAVTITDYAATVWVYTDIIISSVLGVALLVSAALGVAVCRFERVVDFVHGPLGILKSGLIIASATVTYVSVTRRRYATHGSDLQGPPHNTEYDA